jgi:hypothetical protein
MQNVVIKKNLEFITGVNEVMLGSVLACVAPLPFSLGQLSPLPCVNKYTVYTYTVCKGGVWGSGPQADKHLSQSPFAGKFF